MVLSEYVGRSNVKFGCCFTVWLNNAVDSFHNKISIKRIPDNERLDSCSFEI